MKIYLHIFARSTLHIIQEPTVSKPQPMEEEEDPELDISQMLPEPSGFMAFAGSGNR